MNEYGTWPEFIAFLIEFWWMIPGFLVFIWVSRKIAIMIAPVTYDGYGHPIKRIYPQGVGCILAVVIVIIYMWLSGIVK